MRFRPANINYLEDHNLQRISQSNTFWTFVVDRLCVEARMDGDEESDDDDDDNNNDLRNVFPVRTLHSSDDDEFHTFDDYEEDEDGQETTNIVRCKHFEILIIP